MRGKNLPNDLVFEEQIFAENMGKKIKFSRKFRKVTQSQLAKSMHITFQQFQKYEGGQNSISVFRLHQISSKLNIDISSFFLPLAAFINYVRYQNIDITSQEFHEQNE
ncbi:helix-turn-helix transcriptional regulator [Acidiphilium acidophilum]|uniref:helix-turn-helix domain-containing protein n=1 Tax=Acidiphilium acidophilum TaxID=76588 RepID=UPI002E8E679F|nr:helix-turn-helix transcriptional regulator [Acidiphilium acidophilum]